MLLWEASLIIPPISLHPSFAVFWWPESPDLTVSVSELLWIVWFFGGFVCHFAAMSCASAEKCFVQSSPHWDCWTRVFCVSTSISELQAHARDPSCDTNLEAQATQLTPHGVLLCGWPSLDPAGIHRNLFEFRLGVRLSVTKEKERGSKMCIAIGLQVPPASSSDDESDIDPREAQLQSWPSPCQVTPRCCSQTTWELSMPKQALSEVVVRFALELGFNQPCNLQSSFRRLSTNLNDWVLSVTSSSMNNPQPQQL